MTADATIARQDVRLTKATGRSAGRLS